MDSARAKVPAALPLTAQRNAILALLLVLAAAAWGLLAWHAMDPGMAMGMEASPTMGLQAPLFLAIWVTMMVAMMFPTAAPMILAFNRIQADRQHRGRAFVPTWVFVAGYMTVWTLAGLAAYLAALAARKPQHALHCQQPRPLGSAEPCSSQQAFTNLLLSKTYACRSAARPLASS